MKTQSFDRVAGIILTILIIWCSAVIVRASPILVQRGSAWKYNNLIRDVSLDRSDWRLPGFPDSSWGGPATAPIGDNLEGGIQLCASVIDIGPAGARYPVVYYRHTFNVTAASTFFGLILRLNRDDTAAVYLNGTLLYNDGVSVPNGFDYSNGLVAGGADERTYFEYQVSVAALREGVNVLAVENHQVNATSSDLQFDLELEGVADTQPPLIAGIDPEPNAILTNLYYTTITFDSEVAGVEASDLLIDGQPATDLLIINPREYTFYFPTPATGTVQVAFASDHGITDTSASMNPFAGTDWSYLYNPNISLAPDIIISEFMALNGNGIRDDDGNRSDWIELANRGFNTVNLDGWYLTDTETNLTKWHFPAATIQPNHFLIVLASGTDR